MARRMGNHARMDAADERELDAQLTEAEPAIPVEEVLEQQRDDHEPPTGATAADDELGELVNNTGLDGGAASG